MSVLTIAQNVANEAGFSSPSSLVGSSDEIAIQLLALINKETRFLSNKFDWQKLVTFGTFNFVSAQPTYPLPNDFNRFIPNTVWNNTARRPLIAPTSAEDYGIQSNYLISSGIDKMIYIANNLIYITPVPNSTDVINYQYITLKIFQTSLGVGKTAITLDTDITTVPEFLVELGVKLRFLVAKGLISPAELTAAYESQDYKDQLSSAISSDGFGRKNPINMNSGWGAYWLGAYTQDSNFPSG